MLEGGRVGEVVNGGPGGTGVALLTETAGRMEQTARPIGPSTMTVLLINIPLSNRHDIYAQREIIEFPLGLAYIAGALRRGGHRVIILDMNAERLTLSTLEQRLRRLTRQIDVIGMGNMITTFTTIQTVAALCKRVFPDTPVVCGGSAISSEPELLLEHTAVDIGVTNEGEEAVLEVVQALGGLHPLSSVQGIFYKENGEIRFTAPRPAMKDLDRLASPAWELFDTEAYVACNKALTSERYLPIITSRGCPFTCKFCYRNFGGGHRQRAVASVIDELAWLKQRYGITWTFLWDELFLTSKPWAEAFAIGLLERNLSLKWVCATRASFIRERDLPLLRLLRRSGLRRVTMGIESGSQKILDAMDKKVKVKQIELAVRLVREAGIKSTGSFIIGYPGEDVSTIRDTVSLAKRNLLGGTFYYCAPYPGTRLWEQVMAQGMIPDKLGLIRELSDASKMVLNMSELADNELRQLKLSAEAEINGMRMKDVWRYYGVGPGTTEMMRGTYYRIRNRLFGYYFDTP